MLWMQSLPAPCVLWTRSEDIDVLRGVIRPLEILGWEKVKQSQGSEGFCVFVHLVSGHGCSCAQSTRRCSCHGPGVPDPLRLCLLEHNAPP